ncbi:hypothetical protein RchiOBHm_Chr7g0210631 [Rosa chinensis]|uniref:Uncharacterized protein n=1 Tax=Rosa chinensis TaxID=74649 RepID=A0A2P6PA91_ROSCH|nr:hypothetical protein RchiOBHm_Chr7g0210631 [Rosa chinensis]
MLLSFFSNVLPYFLEMTDNRGSQGSEVSYLSNKLVDHQASLPCGLAASCMISMISNANKLTNGNQAKELENNEK